MEMSIEAKRERAAYMRKWRRKNPNKTREYEAKKWERKATQNRKENEQNDNTTQGAS